MRKECLVLTAILPWIALACAGNPGPGEEGYAYNVSGSYRGSFVVEGMGYSGTMDLRTRQGGAVAGSYRITSPVAMGGTVSGSLVADQFTFDLSYQDPSSGCGGSLRGTATVEEGGAAFSGQARVSDSCMGGMSGTFSMRR